jgi:adenylate kinase family enzyme
MRKVLVIGSGGAGKSTFAKRLGARLKTEVIHLDSIYWRAGWVETPKAEWRATIEELLKREAWVMDGNYSGTLELRLRACDTVIFLDLPRAVCLWRVGKRWLLYRKRSRPDMAAECLERFSPQFMRWVWNYPRQSRPKVLERLRANSEGKQIILLRSRAEVERFLSGLPIADCGLRNNEHEMRNAD